MVSFQSGMKLVMGIIGIVIIISAIVWLFVEKTLSGIGKAAVFGLILLGVGAIAWIIFGYLPLFDNAAGNNDFASEPRYTAQIALLTEAYSSLADKKRPVTELLPTLASLTTEQVMPEVQQNFVNFFALGCRFAGYVGPMESGYFDAGNAIQAAVNAGCRVFVLDIDYIEDCREQNVRYFPRLVVRDSQGKMLIQMNSTRPICNSLSKSNIYDVCKEIETRAFGSGCQNNTDPIVLVLYFLRTPPGVYNSKAVLDYYSKVAKCLAPLKDRMVTTLLDGGNFYRQSQESRLLINNISDYNNKVLVFSNANTNGFREVQTYSTDDDLDYMIHLRLAYTQTQLGITQQDAQFGILETAENYMIIPQSRNDQVINAGKQKWTICLAKDPTQTIPAETYTKITNTYGVNCVPAILFHTDASKYLFSESLFNKYSFLPKPKLIRYIKPPVVSAGSISQVVNANQGNLRPPST